MQISAASAQAPQVSTAFGALIQQGQHFISKILAVLFFEVEKMPHFVSTLFFPNMLECILLPISDR